MSKKDLTRRVFLKGAGAAAGTFVVSGGILTAGAGDSFAQHDMGTNSENTSGKAFRGTMFFNNRLDFETLSQAAERIFPKDKMGPGAIDLAVPFFIDNQLAGAYGYNDREYTTGPFLPGQPTQGYQTALLKRDIFMQGIHAINRESIARYKNNFTEIADGEKDEILRAFQAGSVAIDGVSSSYFFALLINAVLAGVYADPIYNGNDNMNGWAMKEYPGAQMSYRAIIKDAKFKKIAPVSLADMQ